MAKKPKALFANGKKRHHSVSSAPGYTLAMAGWTPGAVAVSVTLFVLAGVCEVGGGWLVWQACREVGRVKASLSPENIIFSSRGASPYPHPRPSIPVPTLTPLSSYLPSNRWTQGKHWWWALFGSVILVLYGFVPCAQPISDFGRLYAIYGGFFVVLSLAWAKVFDGFKPDAGDFIGSAVAILGVLIIMFYPREGGGLEPGGVFPK